MNRNRIMLLAGLAGGLTAGVLLSSAAQQAFRRDLFSRHPLRRLAALGYLAGRPSLATARLLREYIAWERRPTLRGRAVRLLQQVERALP